MPDVNSTTLWATAIQIGIPSTITIVSLCLTYLASKAGHQKDLKIAELTIQSKLREAAYEKSSELIKEIAQAVSEVENALGKHSGVFRREFSELTKSELENQQSAYFELSHSIDACCGVRATVSLLGKPDLIDSFELLLSALFTYQQAAKPTQHPDLALLTDSLTEIKTRRLTFMQILSTIYLQPQTTEETCR